MESTRVDEGLSPHLPLWRGREECCCGCAADPTSSLPFPARAGKAKGVAPGARITHPLPPPGGMGDPRGGTRDGRVWEPAPTGGNGKFSMIDVVEGSKPSTNSIRAGGATLFLGSPS